MKTEEKEFLLEVARLAAKRSHGVRKKVGCCMKEKFVNMYMEIAEVVAKNSYAKKLQVGAIAVREDRILSIGYNGTLPGHSNDCEYKKFTELQNYELITKPDVIHAENNLILKLARHGESALNATLFTTVSPCLSCAQMIILSGFSNVYYRNTYRDSSGIELLSDNGVDVFKV